MVGVRQSVTHQTGESGKKVKKFVGSRKWDEKGIDPKRRAVRGEVVLFRMSRKSGNS